MPKMELRNFAYRKSEMIAHFHTCKTISAGHQRHARCSCQVPSSQRQRTSESRCSRVPATLDPPISGTEPRDERPALLVRPSRRHHLGPTPSFLCCLPAMNASISSTGHRFDRGPRLTGCGISPSRCQRYKVASEIRSRSITSSRRRSRFSIV